MIQIASQFTKQPVDDIVIVVIIKVNSSRHESGLYKVPVFLFKVSRPDWDINKFVYFSGSIQYKEFTILSRLLIGQGHALGEAFQIKKRNWDFLKWVEI